jgi:hypothetical protein
VRDGSVYIVLFGAITLKRIRVDNIAEVREVPWSYTDIQVPARDALFALRAGNRLSGRILLLRQRKYLIRKIVLITPDNLDDFLAAIKSEMKRLAANGEKSEANESGTGPVD